MKLHIDLPWGGTFELEYPPMAENRFELICLLIGIFLVGSGVLQFFGMMARR